MNELTGWDNFNVIVGSSAGALIGLQFILLTLIASRPHHQSRDAGAAFGTPTVVHFSVVLLLAAIGSMPWKGLSALITLWGLTSVVGMFYSFRVARNMKSQKIYHPVLEDWAFHAILPFTSYVLMAVAAVTALFSSQCSSFIGGAAMLILLFTGVHNAWDAVSYSAFKDERNSK